MVNDGVRGRKRRRREKKKKRKRRSIHLLKMHIMQRLQTLRIIHVMQLVQQRALSKYYKNVLQKQHQMLQKYSAGAAPRTDGPRRAAPPGMRNTMPRSMGDSSWGE
jgi:hypothetical protein